MALPDEAAAVRLTAVTVAGQTVLAVGQDLEEHAWAVLVDAGAAAGHTVRTVALPAVAEGDHLALTGIAAAGRRVVVTVEVGRPRVPRTHHAFVSGDGGATWEGPVPVEAGVRADVHGVVWTGSEFVATGARLDPERRALVPGAWSSPDGTAWTAETVQLQLPSGAEPPTPIWLGAPTLGVGPGGGAAVIAVTELEYTWQLVSFAREGSGPWRFLHAADPVPAADATGMAWQGRHGDAWILTDYGSAAQLQHLLPTGPAPAHDLVAHDPGARLQSVHALGDVVGAVAARPFFEEKGETGWRTGATAEQLVLHGTTVRRQAWGPEGTEQYPDLLTETDPVSGTTVLLAAGRWATTGVVTSGWSREDAGAWHPVTGLDGHGYVETRWLGQAGGRWFATGQVAPSAHVDDDRHGQVWTSRDGTAWEAMAGDLGAPRDSLVEQVCTLPDGPTVGVGWRQDDARDTTGALWRLRDDRWERAADGALGSAFTWCAAAGDAILVGGTLDDRGVTWRTTDGVSLEEIERLPDGVRRGIAVEVDGGIVAAGHLRTADHEGPVVWFSADGEDWSWAPVPGRGGRGEVTVHAVPDGVVVIYGGATADEAWLVTDPGGVIRAEGRR
ncbi:hypothetical protein [Georgenia ruanii]|uniref:hypothetical protein n=1 Tax=Georgenia ruanii TaxID=348442 RepID=UPI001264E9F4|nr:hypothetical protein [Georgenia ruanii]